VSPSTLHRCLWVCTGSGLVHHLASHSLTSFVTLLLCRFYYDCLMKPNAKSVVTALRKVRHIWHISAHCPYGCFDRGLVPSRAFSPRVRAWRMCRWRSSGPGTVLFDSMLIRGPRCFSIKGTQQHLAETRLPHCSTPPPPPPPGSCRCLTWSTNTDTKDHGPIINTA
jgi:hypothetical protein